jgi:hypothetical protein
MSSRQWINAELRRPQAELLVMMPNVLSGKAFWNRQIGSGRDA